MEGKRYNENFVIWDKDKPAAKFSLWWDNITYEMFITVSDNIQRKAFFAHPDTLRELANQFNEWADTLEQFDQDESDKNKERRNPYGLDERP